MSDYIRKRAKTLKVVHEHSGIKRHHFVVSGGKEDHDVSFEVGCDCAYMGVQGVANKKICSHIVAVLRDIVEKGNITMSGDKESSKTLKQSSCLSLVRQSNRKINQIRTSEGEGTAHINKKIQICRELKKKSLDYITEAIIDSIGLRVDILNLSCFEAIEIADTESDESLQAKEEKLRKVGLTIKIIRV